MHLISSISFGKDSLAIVLELPWKSRKYFDLEERFRRELEAEKEGGQMV